MDRILHYLDSTTYASLDDTGTQLRRGDFRLTSYEWGVTFSSEFTVIFRGSQINTDPDRTENILDHSVSVKAPINPREGVDGEPLAFLFSKVGSGVEASLVLRYMQNVRQYHTNLYLLSST